MENNHIELIEGEQDTCEWLEFTKIKENLLLPEEEQQEISKNFNNQKYYSRMCKIKKASLILFYFGKKIFFMNDSTLNNIFKKVIEI